MISVEGTPIDFLVDTGAEHSVLTSPLGQLSDERTVVIGATGANYTPGQLGEK